MRPYIKKLIITLLQISLIIFFWFFAAIIQRYILPFMPQGFIGMFLLFILLYSRILPLSYIQDGANFFLKHMLLFFIPAIIAIIERKELISYNGLILLISTIIGTIIVLLSVAWVVDIVYNIEMKYTKKEVQKP